MADDIFYNGMYLGSVHYAVYASGQLPGERDDLFLRLNTPGSLLLLMGLSPGSALRVGEEEMPLEEFKKNVLGNVRDISIVQTTPDGKRIYV